MRKVILSFMFIGAGLLMASCGSTKQAMSVSSLGGEWNIIKVDGKTVTGNKDQVPFIGFDIAQGRIYGNSGCNRMMGSFEANSAKPGTLSFGPIAGTRMACPDMDMEKNVLTALGQAKSYKLLSDNKADNSYVVALCNEKGKEVLLMEKIKKGKETATLDMLNGEWNIAKIKGNAPGQSEKTPYIGFSVADNRVYGSAGCNSITGMLKQEEGVSNSLDLSKLATTMMMCADMEVEQQVLSALNTIKSFSELAEGQMGLYDASGNLVITLAKR